LIFSDELIEEFVEVASRQEFKKYFSSKDLGKILEYFDQFGQLIKVKTRVEICRDEKDNFLLNLAIDSKADFLITGDEDLLIIKEIGKTKIITMRDFVDSIA